MSKCKDCTTKCSEKREVNGCSSCGKRGLKVPYDTVSSLVEDGVKARLEYDQYYLCTNKCCSVAYYASSITIAQTLVKVPIWFKQDKEQFVICYCRQITLEQVIESVNELGNDATILDVVSYLKKEHMPTDCLRHMPTGEVCDKLFLSALDYAKRKNKSTSV